MIKCLKLENNILDFDEIELKLYFVVLNKCPNLHWNSLIHCQVIIWKSSQDLQTEEHTDKTQLFGRNCIIPQCTKYQIIKVFKRQVQIIGIYDNFHFQLKTNFLGWNWTKAKKYCGQTIKRIHPSWLKSYKTLKWDYLILQVHCIFLHAHLHINPDCPFIFH